MSANNQSLHAIGLTTDRSRSIVALAIVFLLLATIFVALRVWSVRLRKARYRLDDCLIFSALVRASCRYLLSICGLNSLDSFFIMAKRLVRLFVSSDTSS